MPLRLAIGTSDFRKVRESGAYYVDKTSLIRDLLDAPAEVVLLPRPRRFGKTMNLSMLRAFLERSDEDLGPFFCDLEISAAGEAYQRHRQRYPVIHLTLKGVKASSLDDCRKALGSALAAELERHAPHVLAGGGVLPCRTFARDQGDLCQRGARHRGNVSVRQGIRDARPRRGLSNARRRAELEGASCRRAFVSTCAG